MPVAIGLLAMMQAMLCRLLSNDWRCYAGRVGGLCAGVGVWIRIVSGHGGLISDWGRG